MFRALAGFILIALSLAVTALFLPRDFIWGYSPGRGAFDLAAITVALPALVMWGVMEVMQLIRPRRIFLGERRATTVLIAWGALSAVATFIIAGVGMAWLDRILPDAVIFAAAAGLATLVTLPLLPRHRRGRCVYCAYDLRGATVHSAGCCAECGKSQPV